MEGFYITACQVCLKPFIDGGPENQLCEHNAWVVKIIRSTHDEALEKAAKEAEVAAARIRALKHNR